jgi:hypothetical protein
MSFGLIGESLEMKNTVEGQELLQIDPINRLIKTENFGYPREIWQYRSLPSPLRKTMTGRIS